LAWPHLLVIGIFFSTLLHVIFRRVFLTPETTLLLTSEAVWSMVGFASFAVLLTSGALYAAWQSRSTPHGSSWDDVPGEGEIGHD
jgi:hypothetical protein